MLAETVALGALAGFAASNALETAFLTLSLSEEKRLARSFAGPSWKKMQIVLAWYQHAFMEWKKAPIAFLISILIFNSAFSLLWCIAGMQRFGFAFWAPLVVGAALFLGGELVPKVLARRFPAGTLLLFILPFYGIYFLSRRLLAPLAHFLEKLTNWRLPVSSHYVMTEKELKTLIADRELSPQQLKPRSRFALEAILDFSSRRVKEAMQPASSAFVLNLSQMRTINDLRTYLQQHPYSRIPVSSDGRLENIMGILHVKDLLFTFATSGLVNLQDILRSCPVVADTDKLSVALELFKGGMTHIALVKDKAGHIRGLITLEDILEEIVGEIRDEFK